MSSELRFLGWITSSTKFLNDRIPSWLIVKNWDYGRIMAVGQSSVVAQNKDPWGFSPSAWNSWSKKYHHALYWKFGTLAGLRSRPQAQLAITTKLKSILTTRLFKRALTYWIWTTGTQVILEKPSFLGKGPGQGQIPGLLGHGSKIPDRTINH